jgi:hypothetical protein
VIGLVPSAAGGTTARPGRLVRRQPEPPGADRRDNHRDKRCSMQLCKTCRSLMIGREAAGWLKRLEHLLRRRGAHPETLTVVAESIGPMCDKCLERMDQSIQDG